MKNNIDQITINIPLSWLIKFCSHNDFKEPMTDDERRDAWIQKIKDQFGVDVNIGWVNNYSIQSEHPSNGSNSSCSGLGYEECDTCEMSCPYR